MKHDIYADMKALIFKRYGGPGQITFADIPRPEPEPDEILVLVHAVGLNPIDNAIPKGTFKPKSRVVSLIGPPDAAFGRA